MQYLLPLEMPRETQEEKYRRIEKEISEIREECDKVRKSQFAKIGSLTKMYNETKSELDILKSYICKGNIFN